MEGPTTASMTAAPRTGAARASRRLPRARTARGGRNRAAVVCVALFGAVLCLSAPAGARADTRTATATDGVDPGVTFDIAQASVQTDRDAGTFSLSVALHAPVPTNPDVTGGPHYLAVWANNAPADGCLSATGQTGDVYVNIQPSFTAPGTLTATENVNFRNQFPTVAVTLSSDRKQLSVTFSDDLLKQSNHRCLQVAGSGRAVYDPTQPGGGATYDSVAPVWFDGQAPPAGTSGAGSTAPGATPAGTIPGALTPAGGSTAGQAGASGCASPLLRLRGATRVAHDTTGPVNVTLDAGDYDSYAGGAVLTMAPAHGGKAFYKHTFTGADDGVLADGDPMEFFIDLDPERKPATVTLTWAQTTLNAAAPVSCTARLNVFSVRGKAPTFFARGGGTGELIGRGEHCFEVRGTKVSVTVRGGGHTAHFTREDACHRFKGAARRLGALRVSQTAYGTLAFSSYGSGSARLTVKVGRRVVLRRTVLASVASRPDRRIFQGSDAFFNYCLKSGKELFSYQLRLYCIKPGSHSEAVHFRR